MKAIINWALLVHCLCIITAATGCHVGTRLPLADKSTAVPDLHLVGTWVAVGEDGITEKFEVRRKTDDHNVLQLVVQKGLLAIAFGLNEGDVVDLFTTTVGPDRLASVPVKNKDGDVTRYALGKYSYFGTNDKIVEISGVVKDVVFGRKGGKGCKSTLVENDGILPQYVLEGTPQTIRSWIHENRSECFEPTGTTFIRVK